MALNSFIKLFSMQHTCHNALSHKNCSGTGCAERTLVRKPIQTADQTADQTAVNPTVKASVKTPVNPTVFTIVRSAQLNPGSAKLVAGNNKQTQRAGRVIVDDSSIIFRGVI